MEIMQLIKRQFKAQLKRGTIKNKTKNFEFALKADEELLEWIDSNYDPQEGIDLISVILNQMQHVGYSDQRIFEEWVKNVEHQEKRND